MQQPGGSPYGVPPPEMAPFSPPPPPGPAPRPHILGIPPADQQMAEAASPISSRPPPPPPPSAAAAAGAPRSAGGGFEELVSGSGGGGFPDEDALAGAADEAERGGGSGGGAGNRWPKQETLALIKIRSEMDAAFREATLKGPLWEEVSRKLGELGYRRSAKKCKEKFENVHKYYKRTKENRAGRQDGKSYRFFSQLEALAAAGSSGSPAPATIGFAAAMAGPSAARIVQPTPISAAAPPAIVTPIREIGHGSAIQGISGSTTPTTPAAAAVGGISFSTNSSSEEESDDTEEDEETEETGGQPHEHGSKRKRKGGSGGGGGGGGSRKMMAFFEGLMKQVVERQEAMQQRFLETIEKREQDRMIREEAWRRQEMARLTREQELMAQERAMAASRDAAVLSFIQKISGQTIQLPTVPATPISAAPAPPPAPAPQPQRQTQQPPPPQPVPLQPQPQREFRQQQQQSTEIVLHQASTSSHELVPVPDQQESAPGSAGFETASSSRWPKAEVHALISLRTGLDIKYQDAGPKGPLWEEISAEMKKLGYNRSSKRCKEKWENINKYFKKVKESSKRRPEDSKTCPYFHQLDALYRQKQQGTGGGGGSGSGHRPGDQEVYSHSNPQGQGNVLSIMPPPLPSSQPPILETEIKTDGGKKNGGSSDGNGGGSGGVEIQTSNGGLTPTLFEEGPAKKPEDIVKELMERRDAAAADDCDDADDGYNMDDEDDEEEEDDDDDEEGSKMRYEIQFQRPSNVSGGGGGNASAAAANTTTTAAAATATTAGSFLAMVQ